MNTTTPRHLTSPEQTSPPLAEVTVADLMHRGVIFCERQASARELAATMVAHGVHSVAVLGHTENERHDPTVWGIVSDVDLLVSALDPDASATAGDLAHDPVVRIRASRPIREAAETMATYRVNHLVVIDGEMQTPVGFIAPLDIAQALLSDPVSATDSSPSAPAEAHPPRMTTS